MAVQICTCTRRVEYQRSDTYCCGDGCLNRSASILCDPRSCPCRGDCQNKPFNLRKQPAVEVRVTESRSAPCRATAVDHCCGDD